MRMRLLFRLFILAICVISCQREKKTADVTAKERTTIMLDAAQGGADNGAVSADGAVVEKGQVLKMCAQMQMMASSYNVDVRLVRTSDSTLSLQERINIINSSKPRLLLSLHVRKVDPPNETVNDFEAIVSPSSTDYQESKKLSLALQSRFVMTGRTTLSTERDVLLQNGISCPSVILECGNVDNAANKLLMKDDRQTEQLCREMLEAVVNYANAR
ncbi:MAG: N-acetylmuramoyl-L-alanine amidase [Taibaiella sp.]|nr:N-acetylmuramoyl-L-alanine amidase [Taibaiella sp.]